MWWRMLLVGLQFVAAIIALPAGRIYSPWQQMSALMLVLLPVLIAIFWARDVDWSCQGYDVFAGLFQERFYSPQYKQLLQVLASNLDQSYKKNLDFQRDALPMSDIGWDDSDSDEVIAQKIQAGRKRKQAAIDQEILRDRRAFWAAIGWGFQFGATPPKSYKECLKR